MKFFCYILRCKYGTLYVGWTTDPERRLKQHNEGKGARYTRGRGPLEVVWVKEYPDKETAMSWEQRIKRLTHAQKEALVRGGG